jgi:hypothetical protein
MSICGGGVTSHSQVSWQCDNGVLLFATSASLTEPAPLFVIDTDWPGGNMPGEKGGSLALIGTNGQAQEGQVQKSMSPELASRALLQLGEVHVPYPQAQGSTTRTTILVRGG